MSDDINFKSKENLNPDIEKFSHKIEFVLFNAKNIVSPKTHNDNGLIIAVESPWGSGKSFFLEFLEKKIIEPDSQSGRQPNKIYNYQFNGTSNAIHTGENNTFSLKKEEDQDVMIFKYNAWENDYFDDPFITLIGAMREHPIFNPIDDKVFDFFETAGKIFKIAVPSVIRNFTGFDPNEMLNQLRKEQENIFSNPVHIYGEKKKLVSQFKQELASLGEKVGEKDGKSPLKIVIIDELDRCKPSFSIRLLEIIKHFFNTENTVFIVAVDKIQLTASIKKFYGNEFDAEHYLMRFFDFEFKLPINNEAFKLKMISKHLQNNIHGNIINHLISIFGFAPREQIIFSNYMKLLSLKERFNNPAFSILTAMHVASSQKLKNLTRMDFSIVCQKDIENKFTEFKNHIPVKNKKLSAIEKELFSLFYMFTVNQTEASKDLFSEYINDKKLDNNHPLSSIENLNSRADCNTLKEILSILSIF